MFPLFAMVSLTPSTVPAHSRSSSIPGSGGGRKKGTEPERKAWREGGRERD